MNAQELAERTIEELSQMGEAERAEFFAIIKASYCDLCGREQPCYCAPHYDE